MVDKIKLDIISDVVCPWCVIGYKRMENAISEMGIQNKIELEWQPFELNPDMPAGGEDLPDVPRLARQKNIDNQLKLSSFTS